MSALAVNGASGTLSRVTSAPPTAGEFLTAMCESLGAGWRVLGDGRFLWATSSDAEGHAAAAQHAHHALARLGEMGLDPGRQPIPAILLPDQEAQLAYHGLFARPDDPPEAEIIDGGCWRSWPVGHLAIPISDWDALDAAFAHELVHAILHEDGIPLWLQEGIACEVETWMGNRRDPFADEHDFAECLALWRSADPAALWSSAAFRDPATSRHAYLIAQILAMRWTRARGGLADLRAAGGWADEDATLRRLIGTDRAGLLAATLAPPPPRGLLHRLFAAMFLGER